MSHSVDFRRHVLNVREKEKWSIRETAKRFHIGATSITRWLKRIEKNPSSPRQRKIDKAALLKDVERCPDTDQHERAKRFGVCTKAIWSALKHLGVTYKKNLNHPKANEDIRKAKDRTNVIGALLGKALMAVGLFMCSVNSDVFHAWVIQILLPSLPPDCVVVMDNATFHKRLDTQKVIDDAGHIIEYLPPYSPDLNPVEHKWAEAKSKRRAVNCSIDALFSHYMTSPKLFSSAIYVFVPAQIHECAGKFVYLIIRD